MDSRRSESQTTSDSGLEESPRSSRRPLLKRSYSRKPVARVRPTLNIEAANQVTRVDFQQYTSGFEINHTHLTATPLPLHPEPHQPQYEPITPDTVNEHSQTNMNNPPLDFQTVASNLDARTLETLDVLVYLSRYGTASGPPFREPYQPECEPITPEPVNEHSQTTRNDSPFDFASIASNLDAKTLETLDVLVYISHQPLCEPITPESLRENRNSSRNSSPPQTQLYDLDERTLEFLNTMVILSEEYRRSRMQQRGQQNYPS